MSFLKERRKKIGLRASDMAVLTHLSERQIYKLESDPKWVLSLSLKSSRFLADAYQFTVEELIKKTQEENDHESNNEEQ